MHKMPYKHIAAQLKKTELACRLHYHQLSYGGKRRRSRGASVSSASGTPIERSNSIPPFDQSLQNTPIQRQLPEFSPPRSPQNVDCQMAQPMEGIQRATPNNFSHVPILPKPIPASYHSHNPHRNTFGSPSSSISPSSATEPTKSLRLITENIHSFDLAKHGQTGGIDMARLDRIYDAHRLHFWSMIARNYGCNLNPTVLEDAWRKAHGARCEHLPPTPERSPQTSFRSHHRTSSSLSTRSDRVPYSAVEQYGPGFTPVNPRSARSSISTNMAISSILTEDREVTSPSKEQSEHQAIKA